MLDHPFVSLLIPVVLLAVFSKDNMGSKPVTVAVISIAALVTTNARWDLPLDKLWKTFSAYSVSRRQGVRDRTCAEDRR